VILGCELVPVNVEGWIDWHGGGEAESLLVGVALRIYMTTSSQLASQASEWLVISSGGSPPSLDSDAAGSAVGHTWRSPESEPEYSMAEF
jgi:hypothetical protein